MNPILLAGAFGFAKGLLGGVGSRLSSKARNYASFGAPVVEEMMYRGLPFSLFGAMLPSGFTAVGFAADHVASEGLEGSSALARFADVFAGGILYESAYKRFGLVGAIAAHAAHNIAVGWGQRSFPGHTVRRKRRVRARRR